MSQKKPVTGRLTADTKKRFELYREGHDLSQSDAVRRLIDRGLEAVSEEEGLVVVDPQTRAEQWCRNELQNWGGIFFISSGLTVVGFTTILVVQQLTQDMSLFSGTLQDAMALISAIFFITAVASGLWSSIVWIAMKFGIAQHIGSIRWSANESTS